MGGSVVKRLRHGTTPLTIISFLIDAHPDGMMRSQIQDRLKDELGIGESTGGVNRHLKKLREAALIEWNQEKYTYTLPQDFDSKDYFIRILETFDMSTDQAYFLSMSFKKTASKDSMLEIEDYIAFRYDEEMNENITALQNEYKMDEIRVNDHIKKLILSHNSYVRLRLFKTADEIFIQDLAQISDSKESVDLIKAYTRNLKSIDQGIENEMRNIFKLRQELIKHLKEKRLPKRMKFLIRFALNHVRPSHVYDRLI